MINSELAGVKVDIDQQHHLQTSKDNSQTPVVSDGGGKKGIMDRLSAKISRTSGPPAVAKEEEVIKFKLVEDIRLVTIPITSCLCVLLSYLVFGAILFAHWEVRQSHRLIL